MSNNELKMTKKQKKEATKAANLASIVPKPEIELTASQNLDLIDKLVAEGEAQVPEGSLAEQEQHVLEKIEEKFKDFKLEDEGGRQKVSDEVMEMQFEAMKETDAEYEEKTLEESAKETAWKVAAARRLKLGKADLTDQEDALLREVVQLHMHQDGQSVEQKNITQEMVDILCAYGSFLGKLGWLRAKYHESMKKK